MTIAEKEYIIADSVHRKFFRIVLHDREIQGDKIFHAAEGSPRVSGIHSVDHANDVPPHLSAELLKFFEMVSLDFRHFLKLEVHVIQK